MTREAIIEKTVEAIKRLPDDKAVEISDFADFVIKKYEEQLLNQNISALTASSNSFNFLNEEPEIYSVKDLKEKYHE